MRPLAAALPLLALAGATAFVIRPGEAQPASAAHPVVVELYQSQGCSSCPPADAAVNAIAGRPDVLALSFAVTYWDGLGWKDSFAKPQFTARQWDYAHARSRGSVWTPQVYVNGRTDLIGNDPAALARAVAAAEPATLPVTIAGNSLTIAAGSTPKGGADIWLVRYDPRSLAVPIGGGENGGRTLLHRDIVRELIRLGQWDGQARTIALPAPTASGLATAAIVQAGPGGAILGVARG